MRKLGFWTIPRLWPDSTVFILGGGPSLLKVDLSLLHSQRVIGVNQAYTLGPWVDICWFGDKGWYGLQGDRIKEFGGLIVTCAFETQLERRWQRVRYVGRSIPGGIEGSKRTHVAWNGNSGASAINLAYWLGAKRVVLIGFDMKLPEDAKNRNAQTHWHKDYEPKWDKRNGVLSNPYWRFMKYWPQIAKDAKDLGLEILNASEGSAVDLFPMVKVEEVLCMGK